MGPESLCGTIGVSSLGSIEGVGSLPRREARSEASYFRPVCVLVSNRA